jgi:hypothetical protein
LDFAKTARQTLRLSERRRGQPLNELASGKIEVARSRHDDAADLGVLDAGRVDADEIVRLPG